MSSYPENIDSFSPVTGTDEMTEHAERHTAEESSIVAIETALGTSPEGDSATVADRLDAQDTLIADNTQAISDIEVPDTSDLATKSEVEAGDEATLEAAEAYTDTEIGKIVVPDVSTFATTEYVDEADGVLQGQIDAIEIYDDTDLTASVDAKFTMGGTWGELAGRP